MFWGRNGLFHPTSRQEKVHPSFHFTSTFCLNPALGGSILASSKDLTKGSVDIMPQVLNEGRSIRALLTDLAVALPAKKHQIDVAMCSRLDMPYAVTVVLGDVPPSRATIA